MLSRLFRKPAAKPSVRRAPRLKVEQFEDRVVPATFDIQGAGVSVLNLDTPDSVSVVVGATNTVFTLQGGGTWTQVGGAPVANAANVLTIANASFVNSFTLLNTLGDPTSSNNNVVFAIGTNPLTSAAITVTFADIGADNVLFNGGLLSSSGTVDISTTQGVISSPSVVGIDITANRTNLSATTGIGTGGNTVTTSVAILEAIGGLGDISIDNSGTILTVGGAGGLIGVSSGPGASITIINDGGVSVAEAVTVGLDITIQAGSIITIGATVSSTNGGDISLTTSEDNINVNAAVNATGGDITINAEDNLTVTAPVSVAGVGSITLIAEPFVGPSAVSGNFNSTGLGTVTTANGDIDIRSGDGVSIGAAVSAGGTGDVTINADAAIDGVGTFTSTAAGTIATAGGDVSVTAEDVDLGGAINTTTAAGSRVEFFAQLITEVFHLGSNTDYGLTDAELDLITTGTIQVGAASNTGGIRVESQISLAPALARTLSLITAGEITDNAGDAVDDIVVESLALQAGTGIGVGDGLNLAVSNLAAFNTTTGVISVGNNQASASGVLNITTVDGLVGVANNGPGSTSIAGNGTMNVLELVTATGGGDIFLQAFGANANINLSTAGQVFASGGADGDITLDTTLASSGGAININNTTPAIEIQATGATGSIFLNARGAVAFADFVNVQSGNISAGGNIIALANVGMPGGGADITLGAGVNITTRGNTSLFTDPDLVLTGTAGADIVMHPTAIIKGNATP